MANFRNELKNIYRNVGDATMRANEKFFAIVFVIMVALRNAGFVFVFFCARYCCSTRLTNFIVTAELCDSSEVGGFYSKGQIARRS